jgi:hypothetical protein
VLGSFNLNLNSLSSVYWVLAVLLLIIEKRHGELKINFWKTAKKFILKIHLKEILLFPLARG